MKRLILILFAASLFAGFAPATAQGTGLQSVTGCLDMTGYRGFSIHAPLNLPVGEPEYWITANDYVRQRLGPVVGVSNDDSLLTLQGYNGWYGYDDVRYLNSRHIATLELHSSGGIVYLDIWQSFEAIWVFVLNDLYWYAVVDGQRLYIYSEVWDFYESTQGNDALWTAGHWGIHPYGCEIDGVHNSGVFIVNPADLPDEVWNVAN